MRILHPRWRAIGALFAACAGIPQPTACALPAAGPLDLDGAGPSWNQYGGNSSRTFAADLDPVRATPRTAWTARTRYGIIRSVVAVEGTLFAASHDGDGKSALEAFALDDGKSLARYELGKTSGSWLAAAGGMVAAADSHGLRGFQLQGKSFSLRWTSKGSIRWAPAVVDGKFVAIDGGVLKTWDPATGKSTEGGQLDTDCSHAHSLGGAFPAGVTSGKHEGYVGEHAFLQRPGSGTGEHIAMFLEGSPGGENFILSRLEDPGFANSGWFVVSKRPFATQKGGACGAFVPDRRSKDGGGLIPISFQPTIRDGQAIGFGPDGALMAARGDGRFLILVGPGQLPPNTAPGPATRARNVAYFANWAVDLDTRRVLWSLPDLAVKEVVPAGDRLLVGVGVGGALMGLTDRPAGAAAGSGASGPAEPALPALPAPSGKDGLLLADGTEVEGAVEALPGGKYRVAPATGEPREEPAERILLAQGGGKVLLRGRESAVLARWRRTVRVPAVEALVGIHGLLTKSGLADAAAAVVVEARALGLPDGKAAELSRNSAAVRPNPDPARRLAALAPEIAKARAPAKESLRVAIEWCREKGFPAASACLLRDAARWSPDDPSIPALATANLPPGFPWAGAPDAGRRWLEWAEEIVEADAAFLPADHILRKSLTAGPWSGSDGLVVFRTPNMIFRSRAVDPAIVGRCLRTSESVVRALTSLFGAEAIVPVRDDHDLMDVRLHAAEEDYRGEAITGGFPMPWSAGHYSPDQGVSRFFVPGSESRDPLGRGLDEVLVHELTHHFVEQRWKEGRGRRAPGSKTPGYWCVEGFARFVEDQVVEMDRRGLRFDDRTAPSLEAASQAAAKGVLPRASKFAEWGRQSFDNLDTKELVQVRLRNTLEVRKLSALSLFYEQAGALVFFLAVERGEEGRKAFLRYLADYYRGTPPTPAWKALGFASAEEMDGAFEKFLAGLR